jgi:hypothetical protein
MNGEWGMLKDAFPASYPLFPEGKIYCAQNQAKVDEIAPFQFFLFLAIEHLDLIEYWTPAGSHVCKKRKPSCYPTPAGSNINDSYSKHSKGSVD